MFNCRHSQIYPVLFDWLGLHGTFWLYSGVGVVMTITGAIIIPDNRFYSFTTRYRYKDFPNISEAFHW